jgi:murein DD-endopeptidase MepM/ murein hydrolase activator NlpD
MHQGIDIGSPQGAPIVAAKDGTVTSAGSQNGYGNTIVVDHGGGVTTLYAHQSRLSAVVGQRVARGQVIGYVGSTGKSSGPHLHFEIRINGTAVNPLPYLPGSRQLILGAEADHDHDLHDLEGAEASAI